MIKKASKYFILILCFILFELFTDLFATGKSDKKVIFRRLNEPKEKAFSLLVPKGWIIDGGAIRLLNPDIAGVNNMVDCKFDITVKKDPSGSVMIRWLPQLLCIDQAAAFGNPEGAVFNNCLVRRKRYPQQLIFDIGIPYAHPGASQVKVINVRELPQLAARYKNAIDPAVASITNMNYYACVMEYTYVDKGAKYRERMLSVVEDYGTNGGGLWKNRETVLIRAPEGQLAAWEPVLSVIQNSCKWNPAWIKGEAAGQRQRSGNVLATQKYLEGVDRDIARNRRNTNSENNKDMYLMLTEQNEYKNPNTGEIELDTNKWKNRWVNPNGDIIYSDDAGYNPNHDPDVKASGFRLSKPRK